MAVAELWSARVPGHSGHMLAMNPEGDRVFVGDGYGVAYASLSLRTLRARDGAEAARVRTRHQQPRALTHRGPSVLMATDSRLFELNGSDLAIQETWDHRVPRYTDAMELQDRKVLMTNWLKPGAAVFDLGTGRVSRWTLEPGLRQLRIGADLAIYSLHSGLLRRVDARSRTGEPILRGERGRWVALAANRWLAVLVARWEVDPGGVEQPAASSRELVIHDLQAGTARRVRLSRDTVAVEAGQSAELWLMQRGQGARVLPSIVERLDAASGEAFDRFTSPPGTDVVGAVPRHSVLLFGVPAYSENKCTIRCAIVT